MNYRRLLPGAGLLAILAVAAITLNYRPVEAQQGGPNVRIVGPLPLPVTGPQDPALQPFAHQFNLSFPQPGGGSVAEETIKYHPENAL